MLSPRLNDCPECADIPSLLKKIDCKLAELGNNLYNNISYMLNKPVPADDILQLIGYRRILTYKYCNPNYVCKYSVKMIASRVIRLTLGCVSRCNEPERCLEEPCDIIIVPNPVRTTTTTSSSSTTTSTTTIPPTSTTTTSSSSTSSTTTTSTTSNSTAGCPVGYYGPVGFPNRYTGNGTMTLASGLVISTTYAGPLPLLSIPSPPFTNCAGGQFGGDVGTGGSIFLNYNDGAFTFIITYSTAQTAVKFVTYGMGYADQLGISEYYTFTTNAANTVVTELAGCNDFRVEPPNVVAGSMPSPENRTGGNVEVVADAPFTTITITGNNPGSLNGTGFDMYICGIEPTTTTTSSSSSTSTTTSSSSTTSTTTTLAPSGIRTIYTHFESLTPLTTTTSSSSTSTSTSTTTSTTTLTPTTTTTSSSSSTSTTTSTSSSTTTTTTTIAPVAFGLMYNWYTARDSRNIAAIGWEVPTIFDYQTLADYLGAAGNYNTNTVGGRLKEIGLTYWLTPNTGAINDVGFNGKGSGVRNVTFTTKETNCNFWTRSEIFPNIGGASQLYSNSAAFGCASNVGYVSTVGYSIRLKKITTTLTNGQTGTYVGNDGRVYRTICIGTQEWVADDICETRFRNLDIVPYNGLDNPNNFTDAEWAALSTAGTCAYNNDVNNVAPGFSFPAP